MSRLCLNLIELPDIETIAALENFKEIAEDKIEPLTKCHNSIIGHGGTDRTLSNLLGSLAMENLVSKLYAQTSASVTSN
jgi:hypothetical protein